MDEQQPLEEEEIDPYEQEMLEDKLQLMSKQIPEAAKSLEYMIGLQVREEDPRTRKIITHGTPEFVAENFWAFLSNETVKTYKTKIDHDQSRHRLYIAMNELRDSIPDELYVRNRLNIKQLEQEQRDRSSRGMHGFEREKQVTQVLETLSTRANVDARPTESIMDSAKNLIKKLKGGYG